MHFGVATSNEQTLIMACSFKTRYRSYLHMSFVCKANSSIHSQSTNYKASSKCFPIIWHNYKSHKIRGLPHSTQLNFSDGSDWLGAIATALMGTILARDKNNMALIRQVLLHGELRVVIPWKFFVL